MISCLINIRKLTLFAEITTYHLLKKKIVTISIDRAKHRASLVRLNSNIFLFIIYVFMNIIISTKNERLL